MSWVRIPPLVCGCEHINWTMVRLLTSRLQVRVLSHPSGCVAKLDKAVAFEATDCLCKSGRTHTPVWPAGSAYATLDRVHVGSIPIGRMGSKFKDRTPLQTSRARYGARDSVLLRVPRREQRLSSGVQILLDPLNERNRLENCHIRYGYELLLWRSDRGGRMDQPGLFLILILASENFTKL